MANGSFDRAPPKKQPGNPAWEQSCSHGKPGLRPKSPFQEIPLLWPTAQSGRAPHTQSHGGCHPGTCVSTGVCPQFPDTRGIKTVTALSGTGRRFQKNIALEASPQCGVGNPSSSLRPMCEATDSPRRAAQMTKFPGTLVS